MDKNLVKIPFEKWHKLDLREKLGITHQPKTELLNQWLETPALIPEKYKESIEQLRLDLIDMESDWNETELLMNFISPLLNTVRFHGKHYGSYAERPLKASIGKYELYGIVDWFVASGLYEPEKPYFFIHEYKKFSGTQANPLGQLLSAMYASQIINNDDNPIYGCYVIGRHWNFVLLEGLKYSASRSFDACDLGELAQIWAILNHTKTIIENIILNY